MTTPSKRPKNLSHDKVAIERTSQLEDAIRTASLRGNKPRRVTEQLIRAQFASRNDQNYKGPPLDYFVDPSNFESCYRIVRKHVARLKDKVAREYVALIPNGAAQILAELDAFIAAGWAAFENPNMDPIKAAAGFRTGFEALRSKARLIGVNIDGRFELPIDPNSPAREAARAVAEFAVTLREELAAKGMSFVPAGGKVIDVAANPTTQKE